MRRLLFSSVALGIEIVALGAIARLGAMVGIAQVNALDVVADEIEAATARIVDVRRAISLAVARASAIPSAASTASTSTSTRR